MLFRKLPVVIEAHQVPPLGDDVNLRAFALWRSRVGFQPESEHQGSVVIRTLEGDMVAHPGDWIIRGVKGEFYPCKPEIFAATYERAD